MLRRAFVFVSSLVLFTKFRKLRFAAARGIPLVSTRRFVNGFVEYYYYFFVFVEVITDNNYDFSNSAAIFCPEEIFRYAVFFESRSCKKSPKWPLLVRFIKNRAKGDCTPDHKQT